VAYLLAAIAADSLPNRYWKKAAKDVLFKRP
jgi:hypothetical protein